jgi:hypothetical protein
MRVCAECLCGWKQSLSEFYAGKRLRCPESAAIVEVPGVTPHDDQAGSYHYQPLSNWPNAPREARPGAWMPVSQYAREYTPADRRSRLFGILFGVGLCVLAIVQVLDPFNVRDRERAMDSASPQYRVECPGRECPGTKCPQGQDCPATPDVEAKADADAEIEGYVPQSRPAPVPETKPSPAPGTKPATPGSGANGDIEEEF